MEILFRAWDKKNKGFINGFNMIGFSTGQGAPAKVLQRFNTQWKMDDVELMQYTGVADKLNVETCEGDILKDYYKESEDYGIIEREKSTCNMIILWNFKKKLDGDWHWLKNELPISRAKDFKVTGTIYTNQERLEPR